MEWCRCSLVPPSLRKVLQNLEKKIKEIREKMKGKVTELKNEISEEIIENNKKGKLS